LTWLLDFVKAQLPRFSPEQLDEIIQEAKRLLE